MCTTPLLCRSQEGCCRIRSIREIRGRAVQAYPQISQMTADVHNTSSLSFPGRMLPYPLHPRNPWKGSSSLSADLADDRGSAQHLFAVVPRKDVALSARSAKSVEKQFKPFH